MAASSTIATISTLGPKAHVATRQVKGRARYLLLALFAATLALTRLPEQFEKGLLINLTGSMPRGIYRLQSSRDLRAGELVVLKLPPTALQFAAARGIVVPGGLVLKRVAAMAGKRVCRINRAVTIDSRLAAIARMRDRGGYALPSWIGCLRLRSHELFVLGRAPGSFDGRYFGTVDRATVIGIVRPIWTIGN